MRLCWGVATRTRPVKSPIAAFILNALLPGAGMLYLRRWTFAALNLGGALLLGVLVALLLPVDVFDNIRGSISLGVGVMSGSWAQQLALAMNREAAAEAAREPTLERIGEEARLS